MADFGTGFLQGFAQVQKIKQNRELVNIRKQQFGLQQQDAARKQQLHNIKIQGVEREKFLTQGMSRAFKEGGYTGVIGFLDVNDTEKSLQFQNAKSIIDGQLAKTRNLNLLTETQKKKQMEFSYAVMGNLGSKILQAPPDQRPLLYKNVLPLLKTFNKDLPDKYDDAVQDQLILSMGLSMPQNRTAAAKQSKAPLQQQMLDLTLARESLLNKGSSPQSAEVSNVTAQIADKQRLINTANLEILSGQTAGDRQKAEDKLRGEWVKLTDDFRKVQDSYNRIVAAGTSPSAAGDLALIFNYMKMLDPASVVRESEFATAANAAGVPSRIRALFNKIQDGRRLAVDQRTDFLERSDMLLEAQTISYDQTREGYAKIVKSRHLKLDDTLVDFKTRKSGAGDEKDLSVSDKALLMKYTNDKQMQSYIQSFVNNPHNKQLGATDLDAIKYRLRQAEEKENKQKSDKAATSFNQKPQQGNNPTLRGVV